MDKFAWTHPPRVDATGIAQRQPVLYPKDRPTGRNARHGETRCRCVPPVGREQFMKRGAAMAEKGGRQGRFRRFRGLLTARDKLKMHGTTRLTCS